MPPKLSRPAKLAKSHKVPTWVIPPENEELIEVFDASGKALMIMPEHAVKKQRLRFRRFVVALRDRNKKILLQRYSRQHPVYAGLWGAGITGGVPAGQSPEDAALRSLEAAMGIRGIALTLEARVSPSEHTDNAEILLFTAPVGPVLPTRSSDLSEEILYVDQDELEAMVTDMAQLLSPPLLLVAAYLFPNTETQR